MMYGLLWLFNIFVIDKVHSINISTACTAIYLYSALFTNKYALMRYTIAMVVNTISTVIELLSCMNTSGGGGGTSVGREGRGRVSCGLCDSVCGICVACSVCVFVIFYSVR